MKSNRLQRDTTHSYSGAILAHSTGEDDLHGHDAIEDGHHITHDDHQQLQVNIHIGHLVGRGGGEAVKKEGEGEAGKKEGEWEAGKKKKKERGRQERKKRGSRKEKRDGEAGKKEGEGRQERKGRDGEGR